jgi:DMSO/TMAO reductase YedYZ molybdopterin-dependent catalytic subunit
MNGKPLAHQHGGPLRLVVPFLQGYKSVKWVGAIKVTKHDPVGIKRLLGQSKTGHLGLAWHQAYGIEVDPSADKRPV